MKLSAYLSDRKIRPSEFARQIEVPPSTISRLLNGKRKASLKLALLIESHTGRVVTAEDLASQQVNA